MNVDAIQNGYVIDHISEGKGLKIYESLGLRNIPDISVALLQSVKSQKFGRKDMIKIEGPLDPKCFDILWFLDRNITLIKIENDSIVEKNSPQPPKRLVNVIQCKNPRCITSIEDDCDQIFELTGQQTYRCIYCDQKAKL